VVGATIPWRAMFRYLTHDQATGDESLGERGHLLRAVDTHDTAAVDAA